ncbi:MAG: ATP-dependent helicase, partial [Candidatus Ornithomonoglobus sp.]
MESYLKRLNDKQLEAVTAIDGPLLVLAGAGSGKTTVLANRVAYILQNTFARPWNILAITFTNKAAREMRERIEKIVGSEAKSMWIGTFHSVCIRILRTCIDREGYEKEFVIYDSADSRTLMKECERELNIEEKTFPVRAVLSAISNAKNNMIEPDAYTAVYGNDMRSQIIEKLYSLYQKKLKRNNALDFDDILMLTVKILKNNPDVAEKYQERFQYILVDEYQDTNNTQYAMI